MFGGGFTKHPSTVNFTIHELRLASPYQDSFFIKWKRGNFSGLTEQSITNESNVAIFEKHCSCKVTMYASKKDNTVRAKMINFKVYRIKNGTDKKIFGEYDLDVSLGVGKPTIAEAYDLKSPHHKVSQIVLSYEVVTDESSSNGNPESDIITSSEMITSTEDKIDHWDVSEAITAEDSERIKSFFDERAASIQSGPSILASFGTVQPRSHPHLPKLPNISESPPKPRKHPSGLLTRKKSKQSIGSDQGLKMSASAGVFDIGIPGAGQSPVATEEKPILATTPEKPVDPMSLMRSVLAKEWGTSPISCRSIPIPSVVIFAAFLSTKMITSDTPFEEYQVNDMITDTLNLYKSFSFVRNAAKEDKFIVTVYLILLLNQLEDGKKQYIELVTKQLMPIAVDLMAELVQPLMEDVKSIVQDVVSQIIDSDSLLNSLNFIIKSTKDKITINEEPFKKFFGDYFIQCFDMLIVNTISDSPFSCSCMNAIKWNSLNTVLYDNGIELSFFRQAASALMMSAALCTDPASSDEICPNIPKSIVSKILTNQQPDDFCPMPNNVLDFMKFYHLDTNIVKEEIFKYQGNFSELAEKTKIKEWKNVSIGEQSLNAFTFLKSYFTK